MSGFALDWLRLRAPFDAAARSAALAAALASRLPPRPRLIDLGGGSGANMRWLAPRLGRDQDWLVLDNDPALLAAMEGETARWADEIGAACRRDGGALVVDARGQRWRVRTAALDLAGGLEAMPWREADAVAASALLDLVSRAWLDRLLDAVTAHRLPILAALDVDGRIAWTPADPADDLVRQGFRYDQARDKGFGPALGPAAGATLAAGLKVRGYAVAMAPSDWHIPPDARPMLAAMIDGMAEASFGAAGEAVRAWALRRHAAAAAGALTLVVGHADVLGWPA